MIEESTLLPKGSDCRQIRNKSSLPAVFLFLKRARCFQKSAPFPPNVSECLNLPPQAFTSKYLRVLGNPYIKRKGI